jgi:hypothetical protein
MSDSSSMAVELNMPLIRSDSVAAEIGRPVLQGWQALAGLWFPSDWFSAMERRRRILANWREGTSVFSFPLGDLLRYPVAEKQDCAALSGWPLRFEGRTLCSADLEASEVSDLTMADVWIIIGGRVVAMNYEDATQLDPSTWLCIEGYSLLETYDCRAALPEQTLEIPEKVRDLREVLGKTIPPASADRDAFLRAVQSRQERHSPGNRSSAHKRSLLAWIADLWVGVIPFLKRSGKRAQPMPQAGGNHPSQQLKQMADPIPPRQRSIVPQRWRNWLARVAMMTQLSRLLGRQQAAYLNRMIELFEAGDVEEALRHAISLGSGGDSLGHAFGTPTARKDLALSHSLKAGSSIHIGHEMEDYLLRLYRNTFEKLDRAGRVSEATFVLAELLQNRQEALDYMEKQGQFSEAAELALAWDQPSDVIVRLYCLAGDWRRAVAVARRDGAFANAVLMLEKRWPDPAKRLRLEWADALALQGDWLGAVEVVWPLTEHRDKACTWLASAEAGGGQLAARALVKRALLLPDTLSAYAEYLTALRDERELHRERGAIAEALLALKGNLGQASQLARILAPATLVDQLSGVGKLNKRELQKLLKLTNDRLLSADLPSQALPVEIREPLLERSTAQQFEAPMAGNRPILDAVPLEEGRYLLGFGEAGAAVVDSRGAILLRFTVPAERLVIAYSRQLALALAQRGDVWRVSRLDLSNRRTTDLGVLGFEHFADEFDGIAWSVASNRQIRVIDTARSLQTVLWQVHDLPGPVCAISSNDQIEQWLIAKEDQNMELWCYSLPERRLDSRNMVTMSDNSLLNPGGGIFTATLSEECDGKPVLTFKRYITTFEIALPAPNEYTLTLVHPTKNWLILGLEGTSTSSMLWCVSMLNGTIKAQLEWPSLRGTRLRSVANSKLIFDDCGRLLCLDTEYGLVERFAVQ